MSEVGVRVLSSRQFPEKNLTQSADVVLVPDGWNDFHYTTAYDLWYRKPHAEPKHFGMVKIGRENLGHNERPLQAGVYDKLPEKCFSVGQDAEYYSHIASLGDPLGSSLLSALRDIAFDEKFFDAARQSDVTETSLLRTVTARTVTEQFRRIVRGGAVLTPFNFAFFAPDPNPLVLPFRVTPNSSPPTNVHVLVGRNGSGKTTTLRRIVLALCGNLLDSGVEHEPPGDVRSLDPGVVEPFVNVVFVSFSAFDDFDQLRTTLKAERPGKAKYLYIGLRDPRAESTSEALLATEFADSLDAIRSSGHGRLWEQMIGLLESDPNLAEYGFSRILHNSTDDDQNHSAVDLTTDDSELHSLAKSMFRRLSSGHKIVLLTITRLVEMVAERSLVVLDEPEAHLHPPLLAALVRTLSELLTFRNGAALIATHSPVVVQEVPSACVWKLRRSGSVQVAERPENETFGESVGILTHDVFGLEVSKSGFHREVSTAVAQMRTYDQLLDHFDNQLGSEAKALARILFSSKQRGDV